MKISVGNSAVINLSTCEKCRADLQDLVIGGVGDWRNTTVCRRCLHVRRGLDFEDEVVPLVAEKYGISYTSAHQALQASQAEHEEVILGGPTHSDIPSLPPMARWKARVLREAGEFSPSGP